VKKKKKIHSEAIPTRPGLENSKKISIQIQKIQKHHSGFISCQKGTGDAENEKKTFHSESFPTQPGLEN